jgi:hypothetical protein
LAGIVLKTDLKVLKSECLSNWALSAVQPMSYFGSRASALQHFCTTFGRVCCQERPSPTVAGLAWRCKAAFAFLPFVDCAAFGSWQGELSGTNMLSGSKTFLNCIKLLELN